MDYYRPQMAAYATAVHAATADTVARCILVLLTATGAYPLPVDKLNEASTQVRESILRDSSALKD